jgi:CRP/FNR family transcriptional regulator, cyclic AMP receptor protein
MITQRPHREAFVPTASTSARARLLETPWARGLDESQRTRVDRETQVIHFDVGSVVCREGVNAQHWIGVLDGMVKVNSVTREGRSTSFIGVSSGGWLGEGSLLKREVRPYEVVTLRESWIALVPLQTFDWLYETSLGFNHFLVHQLNARLGHFVALVETERNQTTTARVALCIAQLLDPALCAATSNVLRLSQEEVARLCGLSRQIANRALHALQEAGLIRVKYSAIEVLNLQALRGFEPQAAPRGPVHLPSDPNFGVTRVVST